MAGPKLPTPGSIFGALILGGFATAILYGILCLQCFIFFEKFRREPRLIKYSIWLLWVMNSVHLALIVYSIYWYTVTNFNNEDVLLAPLPWSVPLVVLFTASTNLITQGWLTFRVWIMSQRNVFLTAVLAFSALVSWCFGMALSIELLTLPTFQSYAKINWLFYVEVTVEIVSDLAIALALCFFLWRATLTGMQVNHGTRYMLNILMAYTVNTGLLTSILCAVSLVVRLALPETFIFFGLFMTVSGLYSNSLLGSLNARDWFRKDPRTSLPTFHLNNVNRTHSSSGQSARSNGAIQFAPAPDIASTEAEDEAIKVAL